MGALLTKSNPYLGTPAERKHQVYRTVSTSSAIEGVRIASKKVKKAARAGHAVRKAAHPKRPR